jgi:hypothetical protein
MHSGSCSALPSRYYSWYDIAGDVKSVTLGEISKLGHDEIHGDG